MDADALHELVEGKRLDHVVAGTAAQPGQLRRDVAPRRQDQHRDVRTLLLQLLEDVEAVPAGQREIEDDKLDVVLRHPLDGRLAVADGVDHEALRLETGCEKPRDSRLIFDDEDAHGRLPEVDCGRDRPLLSFYHGGLTSGLFRDRGVMDGETVPAPT